MLVLNRPPCAGGCVTVSIECVLQDLMTVMMGYQVLDPVVVGEGGKIVGAVAAVPVRNILSE